MNRPRRERLNRRETLRRRARLIQPAPKPTRENSGVFFDDTGAPEGDLQVPSSARQIPATLALIEARPLVNAARLPKRRRYTSGVALELATLRDELERAQSDEGEGEPFGSGFWEAPHKTLRHHSHSGTLGRDRKRFHRARLGARL